MIFAPPRTRAPWLLAVVAAASFVLGAGLLARGATQAVSFAALLAYTAGAVLVVAALPLAYWAYAAGLLRYELRRDALVVRWGVVEHVVPVRAIERAVLGRHLPLPEVSGLRLPGLLVGTTYVSRVGRTTLYLRTQTPQSVVYLVTNQGAIGVALDDPQSFVQTLARAERDAVVTGAAPALRRGELVRYAFWADRRALLLGVAALALTWLSAAVVYVRYQSRPATLLLHFPATEAAHLGPRSALLQIPEGAFAWFAASAVLAVLLFARGRLASYLLLAGSVFASALFVVAAIAATG